MYAIRHADTADADIIRCIAEKTWWMGNTSVEEKQRIQFIVNENFSADMINYQMRQLGLSYLLLEESGAAVGFISYSHMPPLDNFMIHQLYCLPNTQGKGYPKVLINKVSELAFNSHVKYLDLKVARTNMNKNYFEILGFTFLSDQEVTVGSYLINQYTMRMEIHRT